MYIPLFAHGSPTYEEDASRLDGHLLCIACGSGSEIRLLNSPLRLFSTYVRRATFSISVILYGLRDIPEGPLSVCPDMLNEVLFFDGVLDAQPISSKADVYMKKGRPNFAVSSRSPTCLPRFLYLSPRSLSDIPRLLIQYPIQGPISGPI
jgi:hypothetical protein